MLSKKTKYAIQALVVLAEQPNREPVLISYIAEKGHIPKKFLELILLELKNSGILDSKKGQGGGYFLRKKLEDISLGEVVRLLSGPLALAPCVSRTAYAPCAECQQEDLCALRPTLQQARDAVSHVLDNATLATIVEEGRRRRERSQNIIFYI